MASIRKHRSKWQVRFKTPDGVERSETFSARRDADRAKVRIERALETGTWIDPAKGRKTTVADLADLWFGAQEKLRPTTRAAYQSAIELHIKKSDLGSMSVSGVRAPTIRRWVAELKARDAGPHAIVRAHYLLSAMFAFAVEDDMVHSNPVPRKRPGVPEKDDKLRVLTVEQVELLADVINPHFRTWLLTAAKTGLRWGELAGLRVRDVDPMHSVLHVRQQLIEVNGRHSFGLPKTDAGKRTVDLPPSLIPLLEAQMSGRGPDDLMFTSEQGGPLRRSNFIRRIWRPAIEKAGIEPCSPHALRHSYATWLVSNGTPITDVSALLGHERTSMTLDVYAHAVPHRRKAAVDALDEMTPSNVRALR